MRIELTLISLKNLIVFNSYLVIVEVLSKILQINIELLGSTTCKVSFLFLHINIKLVLPLTQLKAIL